MKTFWFQYSNFLLPPDLNSILMLVEFSNFIEILEIPNFWFCFTIICLCCDSLLIRRDV